MVEAVTPISSFVPPVHGMVAEGAPGGLDVASTTPPPAADASDALRFSQAAEASRVGSAEPSRVEFESLPAHRPRHDMAIWHHIESSLGHGMDGLSTMEADVNRIISRDSGGAGPHPAGGFTLASFHPAGAGDLAPSAASPGAEGDPGAPDLSTRIFQEENKILEQSQLNGQNLLREQVEFTKFSTFATFSKSVGDSSTHTIEKLANGGGG